MGPDSQYLWTLPMFHCDGWCFPWAVTAAGATHVCLPKVEPALIWRLLREEGITHFSAAPTVLNMIANADEAAEGPLPQAVEVQTGGAPPTPTLLARMSELNMNVTHLYGLTETYGPAVVNQWHSEWDELPAEKQAELKARQGVQNVVADPVRIVTEDGQDVPTDGETIGEIVIRGNDVMLGYYQDDEASAKATLSGTDGQVELGWFRTGDLGVLRPDGHLRLTGRLKDVIIRKGENISARELEDVLFNHPKVGDVAVIGVPDVERGELVCAVVELATPGDPLTFDEMVAWCRDAGLMMQKIPERLEILDALPRNETLNKVLKFKLREQFGAAT
jgi:fatty-acyl-CoA synthase